VRVFVEEEVLDCLHAQVASLKSERDHWKANHADMVKRNAMLRDRPDLGDRAKSIDAKDARIRDLEAENARLKEQRDGQIELNLEVDKDIGDLQTAFDLALTYITEAQRRYDGLIHGCSPRCSMCKARAALDANATVQEWRRKR
jgi:predicted nuclease with TOPRIM domain